MTAFDRVRILVLGDSGVGKTSFVHLVANGEPIKTPSWTIGCSVEVKLHEYKEGTKDQKSFFVEFWDVGGSHNHRNERHVFYYPCHGVILVHDLTNRKSEDNLHKWIRELVNIDMNSVPSPSAVINFSDFDSESYLGESKMPILVVGTKMDQVDDRKANSSKFANQFGADEIILDCRQTRHLAPNSGNTAKLSHFYDKVIENRFYTKNNKSFTERFNSNPISPVMPSKFYSPHQD